MSSADHTRLVAEIRLDLGRKPDLSLWPLRQGTARPRADSHPVFFGIVRGAADLVGILAPAGRWFALEAKTGRARASAEQQLWGELLRRRGGFYAVVRSVAEAQAALERARAGENS